MKKLLLTALAVGFLAMPLMADNAGGKSEKNTDSTTTTATAATTADTGGSGGAGAGEEPPAGSTQTLEGDSWLDMLLAVIFG